MHKRISLLVIALLCTTAQAEIRLASLFSDHAVLQADKELAVWGWANPGEKITVHLGNDLATTTADASGKWLANLLKLPASDTALELTVTDSKGKSVKRTDILVGEVWIGSGQSNMAMALKRTAKADEFIKSVNHPRIRLFTVPRNASTKPASDTTGKWVVCSPETAPEFSAVLFHFGRELNEKLNVPVGLIHSAWGGTPIQAWMPIDAFPIDSKEHADYEKRIAETYPVTTQRTRPSQHLRPAHLYNGMIDPLVPYSIRGVTWYQGENNVSQGEMRLYADLMSRMVTAWRADFAQGDFPFLFVQLAPFGKYKGEPTALPEMWEAQTKALSTIPNTGMAPTSDIGDANDIHPKQKQQVGHRLAEIALASTYKLPGATWDCPIYQSHKLDGDKIRVTFSGAAKGLKSRDDKPLDSFEIAGADGVFVPAEAKIDGNDVVIWSANVTQPAAARFGWSATASPNLVNSDGIPAVAFRTIQPK